MRHWTEASGPVISRSRFASPASWPCAAGVRGFNSLFEGRLPGMRNTGSALLLIAFAVLTAGGAVAGAGDVSNKVIKSFETVIIEAPIAAGKAASEAITGHKDPSAGQKPGAPSDAASPAANGKPSKDDKAAPGDGKAPAVTAKPEPAKVWPQTEIELQQARCTQLLKGLDVVTEPQPAFRDGDCGAPAPVKLTSIGKSPALTFDPPALVTCDMVVALNTWIKGKVQPAARRYLGAPIIRIETMSDYSCRNAYGRIANKLSEHGRANALDIRGFFTSKSEMALVLGGWGKTRRDIAKDYAIAKAQAEKAEAIKAQAEKLEAEKSKQAATSDSGKQASGGAQTPAKVAIPLPGSLVESTPPPGLAVAPDHLGGPKDHASKPGKAQAGKDGAGKANSSGKANAKSGKDKTGKTDNAAAPQQPAATDPSRGAPVAITVPIAPQPTKVSLFLHEIHDAACDIFGTTLGPEANEAHRNHFHVDMAPRKVKKICD